MCKFKSLGIATLLILSFSGKALADQEEKYFDFNTQKFISKEEVDRRERLLSMCAEKADIMVEKGIREGVIPMDPYWQNSYHTAFTKNCLQKSR